MILSIIGLFSCKENSSQEVKKEYSNFESMLVEELETAEMKEVEEMRAETERKRKEYLGYWKSDDGEVELLIKNDILICVIDKILECKTSWELDYRRFISIGVNNRNYEFGIYNGDDFITFIQDDDFRSCKVILRKDPSIKTISYKYKRKTPRNNSSNDNRGNSRIYYNNDISFNSSSAVMRYLDGAKYKNSEGIVVSVHYDGIRNEKNWMMITNAVTVESFSGSYAIISATSPFIGSPIKLYFRINAIDGTLTDEGGDVFYRQ